MLVFLRIVAGVVFLAILGAIGFMLLAWRSPIAEVARPDPGSFDTALVEEGARLASVGNCIACHTVPGKQAFAGGLAVPTPFGDIYSSNITPDDKTGIGRWSEAAFARAMHEGVDRAGGHLYPAFPYDHFTLVTEADNRALYAYLMTRQPVASEPRANGLRFPYNFRPLVAGWNLLFLDKGAYEDDPDHDAVWNRGAYLARGLAHCGACHTPRNRLGARERGQEFAGGASEGWQAYPINAASPAPVPWTTEAIAFYLRNGWHPNHGVSRGPMAEVTGNLARLPDDDILAMATYVADVMGPPSPERIARGEAALAAATVGPASATSDAQAVPAPASTDRGAAIYASTCATCHESGTPQPYGGLNFHLSTAVNASTPQNIINVTLFGLPPADGPASAVMPPFAGALSDADMVALLGYLRTTFGKGLAWDGVEQMVRDTRSGVHRVTVRPSDGIERAPGNIGAEDQPWLQP